MRYQTVALILIFILVLNQRFQTVLSNTNTVFDNLRYNSDPVSWVDAVNRCHDDTATLVSFNPEAGSSLNNVTVVKRSVHFKNGNESWVGDYLTYDVKSGQDISLDIHLYKCVALHIKIEEVIANNLLRYGYDMVTENCTLQLPSICSSDNNTLINTEQSPKRWLEARNCNLWQPNYEIQPVAEESKFASGNFTSPQQNHNLLGKLYWVNYIVQEQFSKLPMVGNISQCGYIDYHGTSISYTNCFEKKPFICRTDKRESDRSPSSSSSSSASTLGLYVGLSVSLVIVVAVSVGVTLFIVRIRRGHGSNGSEDLPRGGKSFTRRKIAEDIGENGKNNAAFKENNRVTTYHQINADQMKVKSTNDEESLEQGKRVSDHTYSIVQKKKNENKPDIIPRVSKVKSVERPGYLSMDGTSSKQITDEVVDQNYDFLESTRSTNSSRYRQFERNVANDSIYSSTTSGAHDSAYDVTFHRGSSQKRLIDEDYDHITIESGSMTMNRGMCESIGEKYPSTTNHKGSPVINPAYNKVVIK